MSIAIITDSNSGITQEEAKQLGIWVVPMPFMIDEQTYEEGISLTQEEFYRMQEADANISTSQPSPEVVLSLWDELLKTHDQVVHIPMSSGLSSSCETAMMLAQDYDGKVQVVDNQRITVIQKQSVLDALEMVKLGFSAEKIHHILEETKLDASIYLTVDTLKYLKKGGRITPTAAALGTLLKIKPILQVQGEKLDAFSKVRTMKQAKKTMLAAIDKDLDQRYGDKEGKNCYLGIAYNCSEELLEEVKNELLEVYPNHEIMTGKLSLSVAAHTGPGVVALACMKKLDLSAYENDN